MRKKASQMRRCEEKKYLGGRQVREIEERLLANQCAF